MTGSEDDASRGAGSQVGASHTRILRVLQASQQGLGVQELEEVGLHVNTVRFQTIALYARDGGCSFPGCTVPPDWCERHHVISWWHGGPTNLNNLTLLCRFHHHHFAKRGWACQMRHSLPHWIPPKWIDPHQQALLHHRITSNHWDVQDPLDL